MNPYAELRALLDTTRELDPEEVAELQLEQGYPERALAVYEGLLAAEPANAAYRRRRDWLRRLATVRRRPVRCVSSAVRPAPAVGVTHRFADAAGAPAVDAREESADPASAASGPVAAPRSVEPSRPPGLSRSAVDTTLRGVRAPANDAVPGSDHEPRGLRPAASRKRAAEVRRLSIVGVG